ncbi:hypothetical protein SDC9_25000 [bioreactor metagenome]|uniref:Glycosyl transferase family 1 domain-containing protein n=1 Tax=bioreactor metagenome TaxID=1076179 RepID=A0A644UJG5_9ZZZZ
MNILFVIDCLGSGGAQRQLVELAIGIKNKGHIVSFLVYHDINFFKQRLDENSIPINYVIEQNYIKRLLKIRNFIRNNKLDAVISFLESPNFICELSCFPLKKWKLIVGERSSNPNINNSIKLILYRYFHFLADYIVANSKTNIDIIKKINPVLSQKKLKVIYNLIDFNIWHPCASYIPLINNKLNLTIAASHGKTKNLDGLIEAVNMLEKKDKEKIVINWFGNFKVETSFSASLDKIREYKLNEVFKFHDETSEIKHHMQKADCIGLFSYYEGFPNAICEGMALRKPIIASSVSDLPLIIDHKYLCNPNNPESISQVITNILSLSKEELIKIGYENENKAKRLFDNGIIINNYIKLLESNH